MLKSDEIGLIAAGTFVFVFLLIFVVVAAYKCYQYLQKKNERELQKKAWDVYNKGPADWPRAGVESRSVHTASEVNSESPHKIGGYRPKIYGNENDESQIAYTPHSQTPNDSLTGKEKKRWSLSKGRHYKKKEEIRNSILNGSVTVVHVNDEDERSNGEVVRGHLSHQVINGQYVRTSGSNRTRREVVQGLITVPPSEGQLVVGHSSRSSTSNFAQPNSSLGGEIVHGHVVAPEKLTGHVIKQNVVVGENGKLVVASLEEKEIRGNEASQRRYEEWKEGIGAEQRSDFDIQPQSRPEIVTGHFSREQGQSGFRNTTHESRTIISGSNRFDGDPVTESQRQDLGYVINTQEHVISDWPQQTVREEITGSRGAQVPRIRVEDEEQTVREITAVDGGERTVFGDNNPSDGAFISAGPRTRDDSFSEFVNDSKNYKVVKINRSAHHEIPDWRVSPTPERGTTLEIEDDEDDDDFIHQTAEQRLSAMISNDDTVDQNFGVVTAQVQNFEPPEDVAINEGSTSTRVTLGDAVSTIVGTEERNTSDVITDFIDNSPRDAASHTFRHIDEDVSKDALGYVNTRTTTKTVNTGVRQISQQFEEGTLDMSDDFMSTPRFAPENQGFESPKINPGRVVAFADEENEHPRQRSYYTDYVDPPIVNRLL